MGRLTGGTDGRMGWKIGTIRTTGTGEECCLYWHQAETKSRPHRTILFTYLVLGLIRIKGKAFRFFFWNGAPKTGRPRERWTAFSSVT